MPLDVPSRFRPSCFRARLLLVIAGFAVAACHTEPTLEPLSLDERRAIEALRKFDPERGKIRDRGTLFMSLDQNLRTWRTLGAKNALSDMEEKSSLEIALTTQVYFNFDTILSELEHGTDPEHRMVAAGSLGFARIPAPDQPGGDPAFPALHLRAVGPLVEALETGSDDLAVNALLSLGRIASPDTPQQTLIELMIKHHADDVRANAAYALGEVARPADASLLLPQFIAACSDTNPQVRLHAVRALGRLDSPAAQGPLLERLRADTSQLVRACAAGSLAKVGDLKAVRYLIDSLESDSPVLELECLRTLAKLTGKGEFRTRREWSEWWSEADENPDRRHGP